MTLQLSMHVLTCCVCACARVRACVVAPEPHHRELEGQVAQHAEGWHDRHVTAVAHRSKRRCVRYLDQIIMFR